jgi:hypothetical protein
VSLWVVARNKTAVDGCGAEEAVLAWRTWEGRQGALKSCKRAALQSYFVDCLRNWNCWRGWPFRESAQDLHVLLAQRVHLNMLIRYYHVLHMDHDMLVFACAYACTDSIGTLQCSSRLSGSFFRPMYAWRSQVDAVQKLHENAKMMCWYPRI